MDYVYGRKHHIGNVEFSVYDDGSLEIEAKGVRASLGGISLVDATAAATIVQPWGGGESKKARADIIAALRELASDLENPQERITKPLSCHFWGHPLEGDERFVQTQTGDRYHVPCAIEFVLHSNCLPDKDEKAEVRAQLEEKFPGAIQAEITRLEEVRNRPPIYTEEI